MNNSSNILQRNLEEENQLREDELYDRVGKLKSLSLEIKDYITNEKDTLYKINRDYDASNDMIKSTLNKLNGIVVIQNYFSQHQVLLKTGLAKNTCYLILAVIGFLIILFIIT